MTSTFDPSRSVLDNKAISALAEKVTEEYYSKDAEATKRWGAEGRKRTLEDTTFTLQHLSSAVFADDPDLFLDYFKWLIVVLTSRSIDLDVIMVHTQILIDILDNEKMMKVFTENETKTLQKCVSYLKKSRSLLTQIKKNPKIIEGFRYLP